MNVVLNADRGTLAWAGYGASLRKTHNLPAEESSYSFSGMSADTLKQAYLFSGATNFDSAMQVFTTLLTMPLGPAGFTLNGFADLRTETYYLISESGNITLSASQLKMKKQTVVSPILSEHGRRVAILAR